MWHEADFIAERHAHGQSTDVFLRALIFRANDEPLAAEESQSAAVSVEVVVAGSNKVQSLMRSGCFRGRQTRVTSRHNRAQGTPLSDGLHANDLWCIDYKGESQLNDRRYCYPLTVTDYCSRYLLLCEALESNREDLAFPAFERLFHERGLPRAIRSDNGVPFASPHGLFQLSELLGLVAAVRHLH
ncbi:MAG TPA: DDE-type integrase/transposase/recombinase [Terriglobales bacterium]|nr:DDE-type integrase/transposase/recombinase [Terriglobales bacterium]